MPTQVVTHKAEDEGQESRDRSACKDGTSAKPSLPPPPTLARHSGIASLSLSPPALLAPTGRLGGQRHRGYSPSLPPPPSASHVQGRLGPRSFSASQPPVAAAQPAPAPGILFTSRHGRELFPPGHVGRPGAHCTLLGISLEETLSSGENLSALMYRPVPRTCQCI